MSPQEDKEKAPNTLMNCVIGGLAGVILGFIPFSTVLGGAIAGYLEGGSRKDGAKAGAVAGLVAMIPLLMVLAVVSVFTPIIVMGQGGNFRVVAAMVFFILFAAIYILGFSVLGGVLGIYYREKVQKR